jgi:hypothetical protein
LPLGYITKIDQTKTLHPHGNHQFRTTGLRPQSGQPVGGEGIPVERQNPYVQRFVFVVRFSQLAKFFFKVAKKYVFFFSFVF